MGRFRFGRRPSYENALLKGIENGSEAFCGPEQLHIDLTNKCNLHCIACWHRSPLLDEGDILPHWNAKHELHSEKVISLIDEAAGLGVKKVIFSGGGDSLLYRDIFKILRHASRKGLQILLVSNLTMANEETIRRILDSRITQLLVNLWAGSPSVYVATHPGTSEGTFHRVAELLSLFSSLRKGPREPELIISDVVLSQNYCDIENMVRLAADVGACEVWFQTVDVESERLKGLLLTGAQINELVGELGRIKEKYEPLLKNYQKDIVHFGDFIEKLTNSRAPEGIYHSDIIDSLPCYMGWAGCRILANGDVVPCCKADRHPLGNILNRSLREVWFSRPYNEFRKKARTLSKSDHYFQKINCAKICDNWWFNKIIHQRYMDYIKSKPQRRRGRKDG